MEVLSRHRNQIPVQLDCLCINLEYYGPLFSESKLVLWDGDVTVMLRLDMKVNISPSLNFIEWIFPSNN